MLTIGSVVIRCADVDLQLRFWTEALDYEPRLPMDDDFALLRPRSGPGTNVSLDAAPSERTLPPRIHLDLYADDQAAEVARLERLGAQRVHWPKRPADADYVIMQDPEGNRFCVIDTRQGAAA
ncbi:VOC family protein [Agrococcus sp. BE272]|uniref:VOC family protein n=1 Tax=Agrococcus sp. BE272 TaxID=2817727 RepID=UPI00286041A8|nr:VOC family protein [Agrococcus sp. BE272]MDR7233443.1 catechol 2,3-dioxygenase-like lactoylglutathione lyase family enzyme [Agrococcus sp. BE272]